MTRTIRNAVFSRVGIACAILLILLVFLLIPVATVVFVAFADGEGGVTFTHFVSFFGISLMRESFANSLIVSLASVIGAA